MWVTSLQTSPTRLLIHIASNLTQGAEIRTFAGAIGTRAGKRPMILGDFIFVDADRVLHLPVPQIRVVVGDDRAAIQKKNGFTGPVLLRIGRGVVSCVDISG